LFYELSAFRIQVTTLFSSLVTRFNDLDNKLADIIKVQNAIQDDLKKSLDSKIKLDLKNQSSALSLLGLNLNNVTTIVEPKSIPEEFLPPLKLNDSFVSTQSLK